MKTFIFGATAMLSFAALLWSPVQAANVPAWCPNSGYDNGPPRSRGPGSGITGRASRAIASRSGVAAITGEPIQIHSSGSS